MWPLETFKTEEILRIGRQACERWKIVQGVLTRTSVQPLPQDVPVGTRPWSEAIAVLYPAPPTIPVTLVLESAWAPVMFIDIGAVYLRSNEVEALVQHRFGLYRPSSDPISTWDLRVEHRAGSRGALAFAMPRALRDVLMDAGRTAGFDWAAMTPGLAWGLERLRIGKRLARTSPGWFIWPEQDRTLVARITAREVAGLNPGATPAGEEAGLKGLVEAERVRLGVDSACDPIGAASWTPVPRSARIDKNFTWFELGGHRSPHKSPGASTPRAKLFA